MNIYFPRYRRAVGEGGKLAEPTLKKKLIDTPEREFAEFCRARFEGLSLTSDEDSLQVYREAREMGLKWLKGEESA